MRSRNIKPGFFENEKLAELPPLTRILFAGLWCYADKEGRFEWRPKRIKAVVLPYDDCDVEEMLKSLCAKKFIYVYGKCNDMSVTCNDMYGLIPNFKIHQNPHPHEAKSRIPDPPENIEEIQCHDMQLQCNDMSVKCNADVMIPDSLIQLKEGDESPPVSPEKMIWDVGIKILTESGTPEKNARTFLGKHFKAHKEKLAEVISYVAVARPIDPVAYIEKALKPEKPKLVM